jgi:ABC-type polysaccharide/polyol phosphate transport system ATPase subunit
MIDLKFDHVSKRYLIQQESEEDGTHGVLTRKLLTLLRRREEFWAVNDVSFVVERGESLGIIGHNGAGKSTILKMLSSITAPSSGEITINGRLSGLIEVGSGFHPELSGRENVYLNGSILGMRRSEIASKLDSIIDFAEIRQFMDTPVKRYSSGMYVRLGFSIAAHLDADILLLDEVLTVGDAVFQAKCLQRIDELEKAGTTIVFVSHDLNVVERLCDRVILMERGQIRAIGEPHEAIAEYQRLAVKPVSVDLQALSTSKKAEIAGLSFHDTTGYPAPVFHTGSAITMRLSFAAREPLAYAVFELRVYSELGVLQCLLTTESSGERIDLEPAWGTVEFYCAELGLPPGRYWVEAGIACRHQPLGSYVDLRPRVQLSVESGKKVPGNFYLPHTWSLTQQTRSGVEAAAQTENQDTISPA